MAANENKRYLAANVGMNGSIPYGFHIEGNATRDPEVMAATEDRPMMVRTSIGINEGCFSLFARAKKEAKPDPEGSTYLTIISYGKLGEKFASEVKKGVKLAVSGKLQEYTGKTGQKSVELVLQNYCLLPKEGGLRNKRVSYAQNTYLSTAGGVVNENISTLLTGRVMFVGDASKSANGVEYLRCGLGLAVPAEMVWDKVTTGSVKDAYGESAPNTMTAVFFGDMVQRMSKLLRKGMIVCVTGRLTQDQREDKMEYTIKPNTVSVVAWPPKDADGNAAAPAPSAAGASAAPAAPAPAAAAPAPSSADFDSDFDEDITPPMQDPDPVDLDDDGWGFDESDKDEELPF